MGIGARLREERDRLGMNQEGFGLLGGVRKQAQLLYEKDERKPDSDYLAAVAEAGVDVLYVLTGKRQDALPAADASEQLLLDNFRRCKLEAKQTLLQSSVLFAAGMPPAPKTKSVAAAKAQAGSGGMNMSNLGRGNVQIGSIGGDYNPEPKPARKRAK